MFVQINDNLETYEMLKLDKEIALAYIFKK